MPRFFFDATINGRSDPDSDGLELPDPLRARREAIRAVTEIASDADGDRRSVILRVRSDVETICTVTLLIEVNDGELG